MHLLFAYCFLPTAYFSSLVEGPRVRSNRRRLLRAAHFPSGTRDDDQSSLSCGERPRVRRGAEGEVDHL